MQKIQLIGIDECLLNLYEDQMVDMNSVWWWIMFFFINHDNNVSDKLC